MGTAVELIRMTTEELKPYGLEYMQRAEVDQFLTHQSVGVLGLSAEKMPYLVPMSYAFDGDSSLYFTYILGEGSRKEQLTEQTEWAQFLVYSADTIFNWQSVLLEGTFETVKPSNWSDLADTLEGTWRPEIFRNARTDRNVKIYEFEIDDFSGIKHTGLSPYEK